MININFECDYAIIDEIWTYLSNGSCLSQDQNYLLDASVLANSTWWWWLLAALAGIFVGLAFYYIIKNKDKCCVFYRKVHEELELEQQITQPEAEAEEANALTMFSTVINESDFNQADFDLDEV
jgi:hypothetical protein